METLVHTNVHSAQWSFADLRQQLLDFSKKEKYFFDLKSQIFTWVVKKVPKSDFQSQFSMSKIIRIFLNFLFIEEYQFRRSFFCDCHFLKTSISEPLCFLKWSQFLTVCVNICESQIKKLFSFY